MFPSHKLLLILHAAGLIDLILAWNEITIDANGQDKLKIFGVPESVSGLTFTSTSNRKFLLTEARTAVYGGYTAPGLPEQYRDPEWLKGVGVFSIADADGEVFVSRLQFTRV